MHRFCEKKIICCVWRHSSLRHAKICFLREESLLKQAVGVVYKDVLQRHQGWPFLPSCLNHLQTLSHPVLQAKVGLLGYSHFQNPDFRIIRIASGSSWSLEQRLFQMKKWQRTDNLLIHRPHFTALRIITWKTHFSGIIGSNWQTIHRPFALNLTFCYNFINIFLFQLW